MIRDELDTGGVGESILAALRVDFPPAVARAILRGALSHAGLASKQLEQRGIDRELLTHLQRALQVHAHSSRTRQACARRLGALLTDASQAAPEPTELAIIGEDDIVAARHRARVIATALGFDQTTRIKIATAVSELARNMYRYAGGGRLRLCPISQPRRGLQIVADDEGPGIADVELVLSGHYQSKTGMGLGLLGCRRLMDEFSLHSSPRGTHVAAAKYVSP